MNLIFETAQKITKTKTFNVFIFVLILVFCNYYRP